MLNFHIVNFDAFHFTNLYSLFQNKAGVISMNMHLYNIVIINNKHTVTLR